MPDWNPVEMIGVVPRNLAFSLYKNLITDEVWYLSRAEMGYSKPIKKKLMYDFCGHPFIDVNQVFLLLFQIHWIKYIKKLIKF